MKPEHPLYELALKDAARISRRAASKSANIISELPEYEIQTPIRFVGHGKGPEVPTNEGYERFKKAYLQSEDTVICHIVRAAVEPCKPIIVFLLDPDCGTFGRHHWALAALK